jgi:choline dehydrogenase-like flavoprotein
MSTPGIQNCATHPPSGTLTTEVCVIGSGCGGATAARVLAEAGHEVVVLEEGGDFTGTQLTQRDGEMYDQLYMDRGGRMTKDFSINVLQGRVLGGGGVINMCDVVPMPEGVLDFWRDRHGLHHLDAQDLQPFVDRALTDLGGAPIEDWQLNRANRLLQEGAEKLGWRGEVMRHNRDACGGLGTCLLGCPINAKRNPRFVAIPAALEAGAQFLTRARATRIDHAAKELKRVTVRTLDAKGYHEQEAFTIEAKVVIVAANPVGTVQLLLRSGIGNRHVGRHLSLQPQLPIVARYPDFVGAYHGIPQAYAITQFEEEHNADHGLWGFRIEAVMGTPGIISTLMPYTGHQAKEYMTQYPFIASSLLLAPDDPTGSISVRRDGSVVVSYQHSEEHKARLRQAVKAAAEAYLASGAEALTVPCSPPLEMRTAADAAKAKDLPLTVASAPLLSAHQQGGVRWAHSDKNGASDPDGKVYGTKDVYVFDSSGFPSSSSSHTMTPIIAFSYYQSEKLKARLG